MPNPHIPPITDALAALQASVDAQTVQITAQTVAIAALAENLERVAQNSRYAMESMYGANVDISGIWDGTDRYPG